MVSILRNTVTPAVTKNKVRWELGITRAQHQLMTDDIGVGRRFFHGQEKLDWRMVIRVWALAEHRHNARWNDSCCWSGSYFRQ